MYLPIYAAPVTHQSEQNPGCSVSSDWSFAFTFISLEWTWNMALICNPISLSKLNVCTGVQSWLRTISALRVLPSPHSIDGCRSLLVHYCFIYLFICIWMSWFFWSKRWLQAHSQMELNCFLRKTWTQELHFDVVISSWGIYFQSSFFPSRSSLASGIWCIKVKEVIKLLLLLLVWFALGFNTERSGADSSRKGNPQTRQWKQWQIASWCSGSVRKERNVSFERLYSYSFTVLLLLVSLQTRSACTARDWSGSINSFHTSNLTKSHQVVTLWHYEAG